MKTIRIPFSPCLAALLSLCIMLSVALPVNAGTYQVAYSGGSIVVTSTSGTSSTVAYSLNNNNYGGGGTGYWAMQSGSAVCQGQITATFTWQSSWPGDNPPTSVIVVDSSSASYSIAGTAVTMSCADGLGDPSSGVTSNATSAGTRYQVKQNPGTSFSINCTPAVSVTGTGYPNYGYASVSVAYNAIAVPVQIILSGTTRFNNMDNVLVGQQVTASLSTGGYTQSNWQWSVTGDPFAGFVKTATTGNPVELAAADYQKASLSYYYRSLKGGATSTVTCSATITFPNGTQQQVIGTTPIIVAMPTFTFTPTVGQTTIYQVVGQALPLLGPMNVNTGRGIDFTSSTTTPPQFIGEEGYGVWGIAQIVTPNITVIDRQGNVSGIPQNGQTGLDTIFPYTTPASADGTVTHVGDSPSIQLDSASMSHANDANTFQTFFLYQPPSYDGYTKTTWVPLQEIDWNWHGQATLNIFNLTWSLDAVSTGVTITQNTATSTLPTWTQVITGNGH